MRPGHPGRPAPRAASPPPRPTPRRPAASCGPAQEGAGRTAPMTPDIEVTGPLPEPAAAAVLDLVSAATGTDSVGPLSEHILLHPVRRRPAGPQPAAGQRRRTGRVRPPGPHRPGRGPERGTGHPPGVPPPGPGPGADPRAAGRGGAAARSGCGPTATCPRPAHWPAGPGLTGSARCGRCAAPCDAGWTGRASRTASRCGRSASARTRRPGPELNRTGFRQPSRAGRLDAGGPGPAGTGTMVRPGRVLPGRAGRQARRLPLDEDPQAPGSRRPGARARADRRGVRRRRRPRTSVAPAWAARSPWSGCATCARAGCPR